MTDSAAFLKRATRRMTARDVAESIIPLSTAVAVALFFADGGFQYFLALDTLPYGLGVVAGLIGTNLFLVMLILAARVPAIDNLFGHDRALTVHKKLGKPVLYLMLAHLAGLVIDYAIRDGVDLISESLAMINTNTDMLMAFLALGVMVAIVVTSLVAVKAKLSHRVWHLIHLSSYGAMILGVFHQFSWSGMFAEGTPGRAYWLTLYVVAVGSIVIFRAESVRMHGREVPVKARIEQIQSFSVHADGDELIAWLETASEPPKNVFVVHGESGVAEAFAQHVRESTTWKAIAPKAGDTVNL